MPHDSRGTQPPLRAFDLLPPVHRTEALDSFFDRVVDHVFRPRDAERLVGRVGRLQSYDDPGEAPRLPIDDPQREALGFAPGFVRTEERDGVRVVADAVDFAWWVGWLRDRHGAEPVAALGGPHLSWHPPVDADKLVNWHRYVWVPSGLEPLVLTDPTDLGNDLIGRASGTVPTADGPMPVSSGMLIEPQADADPAISGRRWVVEGVGRSIVLVPWEEAQDCGWDLAPWSQVCAWDERVPEDATDPDYVTIERGALDGNDWSRTNRWFHEDVVRNLGALGERAHRARRPIVEFVRDLELHDHGWTDRGFVHRVVSDCDELFAVLSTADPNDPAAWAELAAIAGDIDCTAVYVDAGDTTWEYAGSGIADIRVDGANLFDGMRLLLIGDDPFGNRIWRVDGIRTTGRAWLVLETDGGDPTGAPALGDRVTTRDENGVPQAWWYDGTAWVPAQIRTGRAQPPRFRLYDQDRLPLDDPGRYPGSDFAGSTIFGFALDDDPATPVDDETGLRLAFDADGRWLMENALAVDTWTFDDGDGGRATIETHGFWHRLPASPDGEVWNDGWRRLEGDQPVFRRLVSTWDQGPSWTLDSEPMAVLDDPTVAERTTMTVELAGRLLDPVTEWTVSGRTVTVAPVDPPADPSRAVIVIRWRPANPASVPADSGAFDLPSAWATLPFGDEPTRIAWNDLYAHFGAAVAGAGGVTGDRYGSNSYRDSPKDPRYGDRVLRAEHPIGLHMAVQVLGGVDPRLAVRHQARAFDRHAARVLATVERLQAEGRLDPADPAADRVLAAAREVARGAGPTRPFHDSTFVGDRLAFPHSAAALGLVPPRRPERVDLLLDDILVSWIEGHDGSRHPVRDDWRDDVVLALEQAMYDSLAPVLLDETLPWDRLAELRPGRFRAWTPPDGYVERLRARFLTWATEHGVDPWRNLGFDREIPWTWNWSTAPSFDGRPLPGFWRGIYLELFDTDVPNLRPWEMLGFAVEPSWWRATYGDPPYTRGNLPLWQDLEAGVIRDGPRQGTDARFARPGLLDILPVDEVGRLLDPFAAGIARARPHPTDAAADFRVGDLGPAEYSFRVSRVGRFAEVEALLAVEPVETLHGLFDPAAVAELFTDGPSWARARVDRRTGRRVGVRDLPIHDPPDYEALGLQRCLVEYLRASGRDGPQVLRELIDAAEARPMLAVDGFVDASNTRITRPDDLDDLEDAATTVLTVRPVGTIVRWSAVRVDRDADGAWVVQGFDPPAGAFEVLPLDDGGPKLTFAAGVERPAVRAWQPGSRWRRGDLAGWQGAVWRALEDHVADRPPGEAPERWVQVDPDRLADAEIRLVVPARPHPTATSIEVPYGSRLPDLPALARFIVGYQRALERHGFDFEGDVPDLIGMFRAWLERLAADGAGAVPAVLDPFADELRWTADHGDSEPIEDHDDDERALIGDDGAPLPARATVVRRHGGRTLVRPVEPRRTRLRAVAIGRREYRHVIVLPATAPSGRPLYLPETGSWEDRLHVDLVRARGWTGRAEAAGYLVLADGMRTNPENAADRLRFLFDPDLEETLDFALRERALHLLAWSERPWMRRLLLSDRTQAKFHRGMLRHKGTHFAAERLLRGFETLAGLGFAIHEEWMVRTASFGGTRARQAIDLDLDPGRLGAAPQILGLETREVPDTVTDFAAWREDDLRVDPRGRLPLRWRVYVRDSAVVGDDGEVRALPTLETARIAVPWPTVPWTARRTEADVAAPLPSEQRGRQHLDRQALLDDLAARAVDGTVEDYEVHYVHRTFGLGARLRPSMGGWTLLALVPVEVGILSVAPHLPDAASGLDPETAWQELVLDRELAGDSATVPIAPGDLLVFTGEVDAPWPLGTWAEVGTVLAADRIVVHAPPLVGIELVFDASTVGMPPRVLIARRLVFRDDSDLANVLASDLLPETDADGEEVALPAILLDDRPWVLREPAGARAMTPPWAIGEIRRRVWTPLARAPRDVPDTRRLEPSEVRFRRGGVAARLEPWDPVAGVWPTAIAREIDHFGASDPAAYTDGDPTRDRLDDEPWGSAQVGRRWLDLSTLVWEDWHARDGWDARRRAMGVLAPFAEVRVLEWTGADVPPTDWQRQGRGEPWRGETTPYTVETREGRTTYWFWAVNPDTPPIGDGRRMSAATVAAAVRDPAAAGIAWWTALTAGEAAVWIDARGLGRDEAFLRLRWRERDRPPPVHDEWVLCTAPESGWRPPDDLWSRLVDSLAGLDADGLPVPDPALPESLRVGHHPFVRSSWFADLAGARVALADHLDFTWQRVRLADTASTWNTALTAVEPEPTEGFDARVETLADRDALLAEGLVTSDARVLVVAEPSFGGLWTLWRLDDPATGRWQLEALARWNVADLWTWADWYADGVDPQAPPAISYPNTTERDAQIGDLADGTTFVVEDDGGGSWIWQRLEGGVPVEIARQGATIALSTTARLVGRPIEDALGLDDPTAVAEVIAGRDLAREWRHLAEAVRDEMLGAGLDAALVHAAFRYVIGEQREQDWLVRAHTVVVATDPETLEATPRSRVAAFEALGGFLDEVKPFHVKVRDLLRRIGPPPDEAAVDPTDFDKPVYTDGRVLDPNVPADLAILQNEAPWRDWWTAFNEEPEKVRALTVAALIARASCDADPPPHPLRLVARGRDTRRLRLDDGTVWRGVPAVADYDWTTAARTVWVRGNIRRVLVRDWEAGVEREIDADAWTIEQDDDGIHLVLDEVVPQTAELVLERNADALETITALWSFADRLWNGREITALPPRRQELPAAAGCGFRGTELEGGPFPVDLVVLALVRQGYLRALWSPAPNQVWEALVDARLPTELLDDAWARVYGWDTGPWDLGGLLETADPALLAGFDAVWDSIVDGRGLADALQAWDTIYDGPTILDDPRLGPGTPPELARLRIPDPLALDVYQGASDAVPQVAWTAWVADGTTTTVPWDRVAITRGSLWVFVDGMLAREGVDYTVDWAAATVVFAATPAAGSVVHIIETGFGGRHRWQWTTVTSWADVTANVLTLDAPSDVTEGLTADRLLVTVGGRFVEVLSVSGAQITLLPPSPLPALDETVVAWVFEGNEFTFVFRETLALTSAGQSFALTRPPGPSGPPDAGLMVFADGLLLEPPSVIAYDISDLIEDLHPTLSTPGWRLEIPPLYERERVLARTVYDAAAPFQPTSIDDREVVGIDRDRLDPANIRGVLHFEGLPFDSQPFDRAPFGLEDERDIPLDVAAINPVAGGSEIVWDFAAVQAIHGFWPTRPMAVDVWIGRLHDAADLELWIDGREVPLTDPDVAPVLGADLDQLWLAGLEDPEHVRIDLVINSGADWQLDGALLTIDGSVTPPKTLVVHETRAPRAGRSTRLRYPANDLGIFVVDDPPTSPAHVRVWVDGQTLVPGRDFEVEDDPGGLWDVGGYDGEPWNDRKWVVRVTPPPPAGAEVVVELFTGIEAMRETAVRLFRHPVWGFEDVVLEERRRYEVAADFRAGDTTLDIVATPRPPGGGADDSPPGRGVLWIGHDRLEYDGVTELPPIGGRRAWRLSRVRGGTRSTARGVRDHRVVRLYRANDRWKPWHPWPLGSVVEYGGSGWRAVVNVPAKAGFDPADWMPAALTVDYDAITLDPAFCVTRVDVELIDYEEGPGVWSRDPWEATPWDMAWWPGEDRPLNQTQEFELRTRVVGGDTVLFVRLLEPVTGDVDHDGPRIRLTVHVSDWGCTDVIHPAGTPVQDVTAALVPGGMDALAREIHLDGNGRGLAAARGPASGFVRMRPGGPLPWPADLAR